MRCSRLVDYTRLSPHCTSPRRGKISKITIHHMAGNLTVEQCGEVFSGTRRASANYGIGSDGRVGLYVEECNRAWTSSSSANDDVAVTIEVANCKIGDPWPVSDAAYDTLIMLCADICRRNGIRRLNYTGDTSGNLTMHKWFAATACPGPYLEARFPEIAERVNALLEGENSMDYEQFTAFADRREAEKREKPLADWARDYWERATAAGVVDGSAPHGGITRAEVVTILGRLGLLDDKEDK